MILTREEIAFLDVYCHEGTELPFGGPATELMTRIGVHNGDTLNLQWAYLRNKPPTSPTIGTASTVAPPLPWANRDAVLRRDAEIRALRKKCNAPAAATCRFSRVASTALARPSKRERRARPLTTIPAVQAREPRHRTTPKATSTCRADVA